MNETGYRDSATFTTGDKCPTCRGTGYELKMLPVDAYGGACALFAIPCTACNGGHFKNVQEKLAAADIPENRSLKDFDWNCYGTDLNKERNRIEKYVSNFPELENAGYGLFITSKTRGAGKTFLASCISGELINRYETSVTVVNASDLLDIAQKKTESGADPIEKLISARILVLDDLGQKLTGRDWLEDVLYKIIDKRYQKKRVTIVTSNEPLQELPFDDRIVDRLNSMTIVIKLPEFCVRAREANSRKKRILHDLGID